MNLLVSFFNFNALSFVMMALVTFLAIVISSFSRRYLQGDRAKNKFYMALAGLVICTLMLVSTDNLIVFLISWGAANGLLIKLMVHKSEWSAAKFSGILALRNFIMGFLCLTLAVLLLYQATGMVSISAINQISNYPLPVAIGGVFIALAAMTQSGIWPFQHWLTSSLNSPTPVSAIMHAGLVNGGGFLLCRFAPIFLAHSVLLTGIVVVGTITAIMGSVWKLMQPDIKRMLAFSTMSQMGYMFIQCGLGLFPVAIAHLCWHGIYKSFLFLSSGSSAKEKRQPIQAFRSSGEVVTVLIGATLSVLGYLMIYGKQVLPDGSLLLLILVAISGAQISLNSRLLYSKIKYVAIPLVPFVIGLIYGLNVTLFEKIFSSMKIWSPQPIGAVTIISFLAIVLFWGAVTVIRFNERKEYAGWILKIYVAMLNASQPHKNTITAHRNQYQF